MRTSSPLRTQSFFSFFSLFRPASSTTRAIIPAPISTPAKIRPSGVPLVVGYNSSSDRALLETNEPPIINTPASTSRLFFFLGVGSSMCRSESPIRGAVKSNECASMCRDLRNANLLKGTWDTLQGAQRCPSPIQMGEGARRAGEGFRVFHPTDLSVTTCVQRKGCSRC